MESPCDNRFDVVFTELLRDTAEHHDRCDKTHPEHNWWDWDAPYLSARENGSSRSRQPPRSVT